MFDLVYKVFISNLSIIFCRIGYSWCYCQITSLSDVDRTIRRHIPEPTASSAIIYLLIFNQFNCVWFNLNQSFLVVWVWTRISVVATSIIVFLSLFLLYLFAILSYLDNRCFVKLWKCLVSVTGIFVQLNCPISFSWSHIIIFGNNLHIIIHYHHTLLQTDQLLER